MRIDGKEVDDKTGFNSLISDERVDYVIEQAGYYGYCGERVKVLISQRSIR